MTVREAITQLRLAERAFSQAPTPALSTSIAQLRESIRRKVRGMSLERWLGVHWQVSTERGDLFISCTEAGNPPRWLVLSVAVDLSSDDLLRSYFQQTLRKYLSTLEFSTMTHVTARYGYCGRYVSVDRKDYTPWHFNIREQSLEKDLLLSYGAHK